MAERIGGDAQTIKRLEIGIGSVPTSIAVMEALDFHLTELGAGKALPEQLRGRRQKHSLSLDRIASRTGLSRTTIASLERGGGSVASLLRLLKVLAPEVRRRAPERSYRGAGDKEDRDSRFTPPDFMEKIYKAFGVVDLDPCAHRLSPFIAHRRIILSEGGDGLVDQSSASERQALHAKLAVCFGIDVQLYVWCRLGPAVRLPFKRQIVSAFLSTVRSPSGQI